MKHFIINSIMLVVLIVIASSMSSCALTTDKKTKVRKPRVVIKERIVYKKSLHVPLHTKRLKCVTDFINRDIDIVKANQVCQDIFKTK